MVRIPLVVFCSLALAGAAAAQGPDRIGTSAKDCEVIRILEDGREVRSRGAANGRAFANGNSARASGGAAVTSRGSARSSVSVSSSSSSSASGGGRSSAKAVSSFTDELGRTVTTTHDGKGCRIVIDGRDIQGVE